MTLIGFLTGCLAAWSNDGIRLFMKTLAIPILIVLSRLLFQHFLPVKNSYGYAFIDFVILALMALVGDYFVGMKLGRNDAHGYREDSVGH